MRRTAASWREFANSNGTRRARLRTEIDDAAGWLCSTRKPRVFPENGLRTPLESMACSSPLTRTAEKSKNPQDLVGAMKCSLPAAPVFAIS
jgi:hypothetical protein